MTREGFRYEIVKLLEAYIDKLEDAGMYASYAPHCEEITQEIAEDFMKLLEPEGHI